MSDTLFVFPNMEMGDNIVCNGMAREFARQNQFVKWVAQDIHFHAITKMFEDVKNLLVVNGIGYPEARGQLQAVVPRSVGLGFFGPEGFDWRTNQWDRDFYLQAGMDFSHRWNSCDLPPSLGPVETGITYAPVLVHEVPERGFIIDPSKLPSGKPVTRITRRASFWDWLPEIYGAEEIHFVDSSYLNLAETLYALGFLHKTRLVFHSYPKIQKHNSIPPVLLAPWEIL